MNSEFAAAEKEFETALVLSGGRLVEARNNFEYCKTRNRNQLELVAKLEFSNKYSDGLIALAVNLVLKLPTAFCLLPTF